MRNFFLYSLFVFPFLGAVLSFVYYQVEPFESFALHFNDVNFELDNKKPHDDIVFVAVDEKSVNEYGRWPWDREKIAKGLDNLTQADVVLFDMIFSEPTSYKQDSILSRSLQHLDNSVCGFFLRHNATQNISEDALDILSDSALDRLQMQIAASQNAKPRFISAPFAEVNIIPFLESCTLSATFSTIRASDEKFREYPVALYFQNLLYPTLAIQGLRLKLNQDIQRVSDTQVQIGSKLIDLSDRGTVRLNYYPLESYRVVSFLDVVEKKITPSYFKDKIVILGVTEVGSGDIVSAPIGSIPGPLVHYTFLSNILDGTLIYEKNWINYTLVIILSLLPLFFILFIQKTFYRVLFNLSIYIIVYILVRYLFVQEHIYIDLFYPLVGLVGSTMIVEVLAFTQKEKSEKFLTGAFSSYLSGDLLDQLVKNPQALALGGEKKELSILFSDIRDFTSMSESMEPEELIVLLNRYFTPMTEVVLQNKGMLDKYIGDAVMAFFNAPVDVKDHASAACLSAVEMLKKLEILNHELTSEGKPSLKIAIGINTAEVIVGNMGSNSRFNYTVVGDGVNLASRVEGLTKIYNQEHGEISVDILITEFTVKHLEDKSFVYREVEPVQVKGKEDVVVIFHLLPQTKKAQQLKEEYEKALNTYKDHDLTQAKILFENIVQKYDDSLSKYFVKKITEGKKWGVHIMEGK